ncbi:helix-turn-helix domain-containing protein [Actinomadura parmotrematis]|uniref:Helix-turn-helix transcriptional regulator n=1 Tax=Actinomadura parmotrematis TaxID=2864039 RepID=A0ABS7G231_9ACTN|nr:helix-turn-helix transcriptional regulator [Actinomadura parmotrematis]MBW8485892.1 helix-turn-helix transcriptional regulator [Actinomadura parmotrematis]
MADDQGPVVQSALLRTELVKLRKEKGLTQEQVARTLEWSPSKLIRIEGGKNAISRTDLQALLFTYDVASESRQERLQGLARGARGPAWWSTYRGDVNDVYLNYVGYEAGAATIRHTQTTVIPGLLQTERYAEVLAAGQIGPVKVGPVVKLRLERQRRLAERESPSRQFHLIDEAVIRRHVGVRVDPDIMPAQLRSIADRVETEDISVRIIPFGAGAHSALTTGPYIILEFEGGLSDVLFLEGQRSSSALITGDESQIADYRDAFETLAEEALGVEDSVALLRQAAEELMD